MSQYFVSPEALEDIENFANYLIKENGQKVSDEFLQSIYELFAFLANYPGVAKPRKDISDNALAYPHIKYKRTILFAKVSSGIRIARVLGGRQDHKRHLRGSF